MLYTYINHHAGTPDKNKNKNKTLQYIIKIVYYYLDNHLPAGVDPNRGSE